MKTFNFLTYLIMVFVLSSSSCEKPDDQERPTGDHTFSCYIDGELFVPKPNPNISTTPSDDGFTFYKWDDNTTATARDYVKYTVFFNTIDREIGTIDLGNSSGSFYTYNINHAIVRKNGVLYLSKENSGTVTFTEITENNVIGTFEFTLYNENDDTDVIHVTDGRFDD